MLYEKYKEDLSDHCRCCFSHHYTDVSAVSPQQLIHEDEHGTVHIYIFFAQADHSGFSSGQSFFLRMVYHPDPQRAEEKPFLKYYCQILSPIRAKIQEFISRMRRMALPTPLWSLSALT